MATEEVTESRERALLREWHDWWFGSDDAPAKMPNALHIRTAMVLDIPESPMLDEPEELFVSRKHKYESDIQLGETYRDEQTGITGVATSVGFFQHACERIVLEFVNDGELKEYAFDAPRLVHVNTNEPAKSERPGGPHDVPGRPAVPTR